MQRRCPKCPSFSCVLDGRFYRKSDSRWIVRFRCGDCGSRFSAATFSPAYRQKKRRVNAPLFKLLASNVSMRRSAKILGVHRTTVKRKLRFLAENSRSNHQMMLGRFKEKPFVHVQFDDLISSEHTKMKPLTVSLAVDQKSRLLLGAHVAQIPAFGLLAEKSRLKYGRRKNQHPLALRRLFEQIQPVIHPHALLESDEHKLYPFFVKRYFPSALHKTYRGGRGCVAGQGELKRKHRDPLFSLNHTCAMFRANISRLIRKTWCTTKDAARLKDHIDLYIEFHNRNILRTLKA